MTINKDDVLDLLDTIDSKKYVGAVPLELVEFAIEKGLIERTQIGNFQLTTKGTGLFNKELTWEEL